MPKGANVMPSGSRLKARQIDIILHTLWPLKLTNENNTSYTLEQSGDCNFQRTDQHLRPYNNIDHVACSHALAIRHTIILSIWLIKSQRQYHLC